VAEQLAALPPGGFTAIRVYPGRGKLAVHVQPLAEVALLGQTTVRTDEPEDVLRRVRAVLRRIEDEIAPLRPAGPVGSGDLDPRQYRYFAVREQIDHVREGECQLSRAVDPYELPDRPSPSYSPGTAPRGLKHLRSEAVETVRGSVLRDLAAAADVGEYLRELADRAEPEGQEPRDAALLALVRQTALLQLMAESSRSGVAESVLLCLRPVTKDPMGAMAVRLSRLLRKFRELGLDASE
jgi:hypothetical protein